jgi:hypothetical protein
LKWTPELTKLFQQAVNKLGPGGTIFQSIEFCFCLFHRKKFIKLNFNFKIIFINLFFLFFFYFLIFFFLAVPSAILEEMNVQGLTRGNISSHLQV